MKKTFRSSFAGKRAGVPTPAPLVRRSDNLLVPAAVFTAIAVGAWLCGREIGERLAENEIQNAVRGLPELELLAHEIAATLRQQGVCLDSPGPPPAPSTREPLSRIEFLQSQFPIQRSCLDLALAQNSFETLAIEQAALQLLRRKESFTSGLLTDSLRYRTHRRVRR